MKYTWSAWQKYICFLLVSLSVIYLPVFSVQAADLLKGPYLIYQGNNTEMLVVWQAEDSLSNALIEYGPDEQLGHGPFTSTAYDDNQYSYKFCGLVPGEQYFYRVDCGAAGVFLGSFFAAPAIETKSTTIYAYGDSRTYVEVHNRLLGVLWDDLAQEKTQRQTVLLHSGDIVEAGSKEKAWQNQLFERSQQNIRRTHAHLPLMAALGNHDGNGSLFRKYLPYQYASKERAYYSFDYGPVHIAVVDDSSSRKPDSEQYLWLEEDLKNTDRAWKLVMFHRPAWGSGQHHSCNSGNQLLTEQLFEPLGVDLVIAGHNHNYARHRKSGIVHLTTGGGGAPLYDADLTAAYIEKVAKKHHFLRIDIDGEQLKVTVIDDTGHEIDQFDLQHPTNE